MSNKTIADLQTRRAALVAQIEKLDREISQAGFVDSIVPGSYVYGKLADGTEYSHAKVLGKTEAEGTSGVWYKLRLNEDTPEEIVKSVRLSNIDGVEGADAPADDTAAGAGSKSKKEIAAEEI